MTLNRIQIAERRAWRRGWVRSFIALIEGQHIPDLPDRPKIVCLCGSTRFRSEFQQANYDETMAGRIVLSVGCFVASEEEHPVTSSQKAALDELHLRKIDLADEILVINVGGYIGLSTSHEIKYAIETSKKVRWLEESES